MSRLIRIRYGAVVLAAWFAARHLGRPEPKDDVKPHCDALTREEPRAFGAVRASDGAPAGAAGEAGRGDARRATRSPGSAPRPQAARTAVEGRDPRDSAPGAPWRQPRPAWHAFDGNRSRLRRMQAGFAPGSMNSPTPTSRLPHSEGSDFTRDSRTRCSRPTTSRAFQRGTSSKSATLDDDDAPIPNPLQQTYDKRAHPGSSSAVRCARSTRTRPIPNPLQQTYDKRFATGGGGGGGFGGIKTGGGKRRGPRRSDRARWSWRAGWAGSARSGAPGSAGGRRRGEPQNPDPHEDLDRLRGRRCA